MIPPINSQNTLATMGLTFIGEEVSPISTLYQRYLVSLSQRDVYYQKDSHDFGVVIKKMLISKESLDADVEGKAIPFCHIYADLKRVGGELGIEIVSALYQYPVRDHFFIFPKKGMFLLYSFPTQLPKAMEQIISLIFQRQNSGFALSSHPSFCGNIGMSASHIDLAVADHSKRNHVEKMRGLDLYIEGGDYFIASDLLGTRHLFIGEQHIDLNHQLGRLRSILHAPPSLIQEKLKTLTPQEVIRALLDLHALGNIELGQKSGLIDSKLMKQFMNAPNPYSFAKESETTTKISINPLVTAKEQKDHKLVAAKYLLQKESLFTILADRFEVLPENIHPLPSVTYHLDCFCKPGPNGSFFLQDFTFSSDLLETLLENGSSFNFTQKDRELILRMIRAGRLLAEEVGHLLEEAKHRIERAGFTVIPTPGIFIDEPTPGKKFTARSKISQINFINAVSGFSECKKLFYYIAYGTSVGDRLGKALMDAFTIFLHQYNPSLEIHFIGAHPMNREDFSEADAWMSKLGAQAGPDCMTLAIETDTHFVPTSL